MKTCRVPVKKAFCFCSRFGRSRIPIYHTYPGIPTSRSNTEQPEARSCARGKGQLYMRGWAAVLKGPRLLSGSSQWGGNGYEKLDGRISVWDFQSDKFTYFNPRTKFSMNSFKAEYGTSLVRVLSTLPHFAGSPLKKHQCVLKHILTSNAHRKIQEFYSVKRSQHRESLLWYLLTGSEKWLSLNFLQVWKDVQNFQRQGNLK